MIDLWDRERGGFKLLEVENHYVNVYLDKHMR
jgi:hypothetical protein